MNYVKTIEFIYENYIKPEDIKYVERIKRLDKKVNK